MILPEFIFTKTPEEQAAVLQEVIANIIPTEDQADVIALGIRACKNARSATITGTAGDEHYLVRVYPEVFDKGPNSGLTIYKRLV